MTTIASWIGLFLSNLINLRRIVILNPFSMLRSFSRQQKTNMAELDSKMFQQKDDRFVSVYHNYRIFKNNNRSMRKQ